MPISCAASARYGALMKLFTFGTTRGVAPCVLLEELGVEYDLVTVDIRSPQRPAELAAIHPLGRIPVLVTNDHVLDQSAAILIFLAERFGKFLPRDEPARTDTLRWLMVAATDVMSEHAQVFRNLRRPDGAVSDLLKENRARLAATLRECDRRLAHSTYLAGELSIADFALYTIVRQYSAESLHRLELRHMLPWLDRISSRPAVQTAEKKCPYIYDVSSTLE